MGKRNQSHEYAWRIGVRIQFLRLERRLSLRQLAQMAKCTISSLSLIESGGAPITVCTLGNLAQALRVRPLDLMNHDPESGDIEYIAEKIRNDPAAYAKVKAQLKAWDAIATGRDAHVTAARKRKAGSRNGLMR